jgi:spore germination protein KC
MRRTKAKRKPFLQLGLLLSLLFPVLTGCWSAHEISNIAIVNALGIDQNDQGQLEVTTVIVKPSHLFPEIGESGHPSQHAYLVRTETGKNMLEAMEKLSNSLPEQIYFGHLETVIFGRKAAMTQIQKCLDFLNRGTDFRPNIKLLVANGRAKDIVSETPELNSTIGLEIQDLVDTKRYGTSQMVEDISQFTEKMDDNTEDPYTGFIGTKPLNSLPTSTGPSKPQEQSHSTTQKELTKPANDSQKSLSNTLQLQGTAVFKGSHFIGVLNEPETQGFLLLKGKLQNSVVTLNCGGGDQGDVGIQIRGSKATYTPAYSLNHPSMSVSISVNADIGQYTCKKGVMSPKEISQMNHRLETILKQQAEDTLNVAQKNWQTDIFGFGKAFYQKDPVQWKLMAPVWREKLLKDMDVNVKVTTNINRFGLRKETSHVNETR